MMNIKKSEVIDKKTNPNKWDVFDCFADATYVTSYEDTFLYANDEACRFWGKTREELVGKPIYIVFPETKGSVLEEKRLECLETRSSLVAEFYFSSPPYEGWYELIHSPCQEGIITRFRLIPEKKKASYSLDFLYELITMFLNQLEDPVMVLDLRYKIKEGNRSLPKFAGVTTKSNLIGKNFFDRFFPDKEQVLKPTFQKVFQERKSRTVIIDGLQMTKSTIIKSSEAASVLPQHPPINTDQSLLEPSSRDEFYEILWDQSGIPTGVFNPQGQLICVNDSMNTLFSERINKEYNILLDPCLSSETIKKIQNQETIHTEIHFGPEDAKLFFANKTSTIREEYFLDVLIKPFYQKGKKTLQGYILKLVDRMEAKKKEELREQVFERILANFKKSTDQMKESISTLLLFVKESEDKKFLSKNLRHQRQILNKLIGDISKFKDFHYPPAEE
jgi:PAS domain S-box-containing protein